MDKKQNWSWLPSMMPGVAQLMAARRKEFGDAHVNECWKRGVVLKEPGWFFAREGTLAVGVPWDEPVLANFAAANVTSSQALLIIKEGKRGTH